MLREGVWWSCDPLWQRQLLYKCNTCLQRLKSVLLHFQGILFRSLKINYWNGVYSYVINGILHQLSAANRLSNVYGSIAKRSLCCSVACRQANRWSMDWVTTEEEQFLRNPTREPTRITRLSMPDQK